MQMSLSESALQCADPVLIPELQGKVIGFVTIVFPTFKTGLDEYRGTVRSVCTNNGEGPRCA